MNFIPEHLSSCTQQELLEYYDNPKNFFIPDFRDEVNNLQKNSFPKHITALLTHGIFSINSEKRRAIEKHIWATREEINRLLKNFSDWWTRKIIKKSLIPESNIIIPESPRLEWDPARDIDSNDIVREKDFNGNKLLPEKTIKKLQSSWSSWKTNHGKYHGNIRKKLHSIESSHGWSITFDIHDTWVRMMKLDSKNDSFRISDDWWLGYPMMEIGTLEWASCNPEILEYFIKQVEKYFDFTPVVNKKYKWGYVTQKHWEQARKELEKKWENPQKRNVLQIELGRYLYMKESIQEMDWEQAEKVWAALRMCIQKTAEEFDDEYFANLD